MTDESKKPSERVTVVLVMGGIVTDHTSLAAFLDTEHDRRAAFEADVLNRLAKLEALNRRCPVHDMQGQAVCPDCGWAPKVTKP